MSIKRDQFTEEYKASHDEACRILSPLETASFSGCIISERGRAALTIKWDQFTDEYKASLDEACRILIKTARRNPSGECLALVRVVDAETGETFQIAVWKAGQK